MVRTEQRQAIEELVYRTCIALDDKNWKGFFDLCDAGFRYTISTYSPEIKREMTWLDYDRPGLEMLFGNLPKHNSDHSPITRHATVYTVDAGETADEFKVVSAVQVFRTALDGGASELFAVGRLNDTVKLNGSGPKLAKRVVRLDTRLLAYGYHIPF